MSVLEERENTKKKLCIYFFPILLVFVQMKLLSLLLAYYVTMDRLGAQTGLLIFVFFFFLAYSFCLYVCSHVNCSF